MEHRTSRRRPDDAGLTHRWPATPPAVWGGVRRAAYAGALMLAVGSVWSYARVKQLEASDVFAAGGTLNLPSAAPAVRPPGVVARLVRPFR